MASPIIRPFWKPTSNYGASAAEGRASITKAIIPNIHFAYNPLTTTQFHLILQIISFRKSAQFYENRHILSWVGARSLAEPSAGRSIFPKPILTGIRTLKSITTV
jgi:hypothetical protein